ncbi:MAG: hypothetical protein ACPF9K_05510 [Neptuniibacter sp.]
MFGCSAHEVVSRLRIIRSNRDCFTRYFFLVFIIAWGNQIQANTTDAAINSKKTNIELVAEIYEHDSYRVFINNAAETAAEAYSSDLKGKFDKRFNMDVPQEYVDVAKDCYLGFASYKNLLPELSSMYAESLSRAEIEALVEEKSSIVGQLLKDSSAISEDSRAKLHTALKDFILAEKRKCFIKFKQVVRPYYKSVLEGRKANEK